MDGFSYTNIFETKGIEYIVIIAFFILIIPFWYLLNRKRPVFVTKKASALSLLNYKIPMGIFFSRNHTWAFLESSGLASTGLDDFLLRVSGKLKINLLRKEGESVKRGDLIAEGLQGDRRLRIYSPVSGIISMVNRNSGEVSGDPYNEGWLFKVVPSDWKAETRSFLLGDEARVWINHELERFRDMAASFGAHRQGNLMPVLQDGGEIIGHPLSELPLEAWNEFEKSFLTLEDYT